MSMKEYKRICVVFAVAALILTVLMPRAHKFEYDYHQGSPWRNETLISEFDFPLYKSSEQIIKESSDLRSEVVPYYRFSAGTTAKILSAAEALPFGDISSRAAVLSSLRRVCTQGILPDELPARRSNFSEDMVYVQKDKRAVKYPVTELYRQSEVREALLSDLTADHDFHLNADSLLRAIGIYDIIQPNLVYDAQTTTLVHSESTPEVSPTLGYVSAGTVIVSEGEIITADIMQMLDSYKKEYEINMGSDVPRIGNWIGNLLIALAIAFAWALVVLLGAPEMAGRMKYLLYIVFIMLVAALPAVIFGREDTPQRFLFMMPMTLVVYYLQPFFKDRLVLPLYMASLLPLLVCIHSGAVIYVIFLVGGMVTILLSHRFSRGGEGLVTAAATFVAMLLTYLAFRLLSAFTGPIWLDMLFILTGCALPVVLSPLVSIFEKMFGLLSASTLDELVDAGNPLLQEFESKAPGTFQHSLQVMSMCENVARSIGADVHLIRAGAMYHDIGKMLNPNCFVENESLLGRADGTKYHESLTPQQSAADISRHVTDGMAIAVSGKLPAAVREFIITHHGTSCVQYFYTQYLNAGGDPAAREEFCYKGRKPRTREQVILMICDSVEAASRSLREHSATAFSDLVEKIVASKMSEGQFDEADISIRDLYAVKASIKTYLAQVNHDRVKYPKLKKKNKQLIFHHERNEKTD